MTKGKNYIQTLYNNIPKNYKKKKEDKIVLFVTHAEIDNIQMRMRSTYNNY